MTADLSALIARLEAAEVGSRELDDSVVISAFDGEMMDWWDEATQQHQIKAGDGSRVNVTPITTSLDAALALAERVLPGWAMNVCLDKDRDGTLLGWSSQVARHGLEGPVGRDRWFGVAPTPALALCIAILRAKQGEGA